MILPWGQTTRSRESRTQSAPPGRRAGLGTITGSNEPTQSPRDPTGAISMSTVIGPHPARARSYPPERVCPVRAGPVGSPWMFDRRDGENCL